MGQQRDFRILKSRILKARKVKTQVRYEKKNFDPRDLSWDQCQKYLANLSTRFSSAIVALDEAEVKLINVGWRYFLFDSHRKDLNGFKRVDVYDRWFKLVYAGCTLDSVNEYTFDITTFENEFKRELSNDLYYIKLNTEYTKLNHNETI